MSNEMYITIPATFDPPPGAKGDKLAMIAEKLQLLTSMTKEYRAGFFIPVPVYKWRKLIGGRHTQVFRLAEDDLLEINHRYSYGSKSNNPFPKSFRLKERHRHFRSKPYMLKTKPMQDRYRTASRELDADNLGTAGLHLASKLGGFQISDRAKSGTRGFWEQYTINRILNGKNFAHRCQFGRLHTGFTLLPKTARQFLSAQNQPLVTVDVSACQPLLLGIMARSKNAQHIIVQCRIGSGVGRMGIPLGHLCLKENEKKGSKSEPADLQEWIELCQQSDLYRYLWEAVRGAPDPAIVSITSKAGIKIERDMRELSLKSFKRSCFIPLFGTLSNMVRNPVFAVIRSEFPTIAQFVIETKQTNYRHTAHLAQAFESSLMIDDLGNEFARSYPNVTVTTIHDAVMVPEDFAGTAANLIQEQFARWNATPRIKIESTHLGTA